jgi:hypothetical protein
VNASFVEGRPVYGEDSKYLLPLADKPLSSMLIELRRISAPSHALRFPSWLAVTLHNQWQ